MMKDAMRHKLTCGGLLCALLLPLHAQAAFKCWTNSEGVRECGNAIPPEYAQQESETINERGVTIEVQERAKTREELEAERLRQEEEARLKAEEERQRQEQAAYDRVLLSTFLSEEEITRAYERKVSAIDANIELNRLTMEKLESDLEKEEKRAEGYRHREKPLPDNMQEAIDSMQRQIADKKRYIEAQQEDRARLTEQYKKDIERFRELKANGRTLR